MSISRSVFLAALMLSSVATTAVRGDDLAATVAGKMRESGALKGYRVNVKAKSGTVWLEGSVSDARQIDAALAAAESVAGVERVVNRLTVGKEAAGEPTDTFTLPASIRALVGMPTPAVEPVAAKTEAAVETDASAEPALLVAEESAEPQAEPIQLTQAVERPKQPVKSRPRPLAAQGARPVPQFGPSRSAAPSGVQRTAMRTRSMKQPMELPAGQAQYGDEVVGGDAAMDGGYAGPGPVANGQMVPGSMRFTEGPAGGGYCPPGQAGMGGGMGGAGGPMPMGGPGMGAGGMGGPGGMAVPVRGNGPNMPNYAWPSYSAYPNYAALQYPTQYSPTAWPYIGPFYPYPQVPLGWRRVSLEWDDGWWWLDFDERHIHSHPR